MKKLFKNVNIITHEGDILEHQDVLIENELIREVGADLKLEDAEVIECGGKYMAPGFVALHAHSPMNIFKGIAEDVHIDDWFNREIWPYESKMSEEDIYWGTKLACAEMLNNGITAFADHYFKSDVIAKACKQCGIKADIAYTIFGFGGNCDAELALAEKFVRDFKGDEMISPRLGPHSPYICSKDVLKTIVHKAKELNCGIHIHVSETERQLQDSMQLHDGQTPYDVLAECGGFEVPCIVGHGLWVQESDLKYYNDNVCTAVSPKTYMKLGMGEGNLWKYWKKMNVVSGNDGSASSNSIDVLEQIRMFALLGKWNDKAVEMTLKEMWQVLMNGHRYLNFNSGRIEPGYSADFNLFDLSSVSLVPLYRPLAAILYSVQPSVHITDTMVHGQFVKKDGKLLLDTEEIIEKSVQCAKEIYARGKGESQLHF